MYRPLHRHNSGGQAACQGASGLVRHSVCEIDCQLRMDHAPILASARPFLGNVHHGQVQHFQQAVICGENGLGLGHFPQLAVKALNGVGGVDQPAYLLKILEVSTQIGPVILQGDGDFGIFLVPTLETVLISATGRIPVESIGITPATLHSMAFMCF